MGETTKVALALIGIALLFCNGVVLGVDGPSWALAGADVIAGACIVLGLFLSSRFTEQGQAERLMGNTTMSRSFIYSAGAIVSLLTGVQGFVNPKQESGMAIASILLASVFGFLAFRERRKSRTGRDLSLNSNPLAALNAHARTEPTPSTPGSSVRTLIVIAIFGVLLAIADVRTILMATGANDVWIGVGQMVIWLPVCVYAAYCEVRRMKKAR